MHILGFTETARYLNLFVSLRQGAEITSKGVTPQNFSPRKQMQKSLKFFFCTAFFVPCLNFKLKSFFFFLFPFSATFYFFLASKYKLPFLFLRIIKQKKLFVFFQQFVWVPKKQKIQKEEASKVFRQPSMKYVSGGEGEKFHISKSFKRPVGWGQKKRTRHVFYGRPLRDHSQTTSAWSRPSVVTT